MFSILMIGFFLIVGASLFAVWLYSLIHCIRNRFLSDQNRTIGIILIAILGIIGSVVYLFLPRESQAQR